MGWILSTPVQQKEECYKTLAQLKKEYYRDSYLNKNNQEALVEINRKYDSDKKKFNICLYTKSFILSDYAEISNDFFERFALAKQLKGAPKFSDSDFVKFYSFWTRVRSHDILVDEKIRSIISFIKSKDPRNIVTVSVPTHTKNANISMKEKVEKSIYCVPCKKGFRSENTLKDHLKSKQHISHGISYEQAIIYKRAINYETFAYERNDCFKNNNFDSESCENDDIVEEKKIAEEKNDSFIEKKILEEKNDSFNEKKNDSSNEKKNDSFIKKEHAAFRTCSFCKTIFETRSALILHLRDEH